MHYFISDFSVRELRYVPDDALILSGVDSHNGKVISFRCTGVTKLKLEIDGSSEFTLSELCVSDASSWQLEEVNYVLQEENGPFSIYCRDLIVSES